MTTPQELDDRFRAAIADLAQGSPPEPASDTIEPLTGEQLRDLFDAQLASRHLDLAARWLRGFGEGFHTTASAGHEGTAAVAAVLRPTDPALLHARSAAFYCARAAQVSGVDPVRDVIAGVVAVTTEPIAGGRAKVFGRADLAVVPVTSTSGTHLVRAVGLAYAIEHPPPLTPPSSEAGPHTGRNADVGAGLAPASGAPTRWAADAIVACTFTDDQIDHPAVRAALAGAAWFAHSAVPLPLLLVCEESAPGVGDPDPQGWVAASLTAQPEVRRFTADGGDLVETSVVAAQAVAWVRRQRRPAVLHLRTAHLLTDDPGGRGETRRDPAIAHRDPVIATARRLAAAGEQAAEEILARYDQVGWRVRRIAEEVLAEPRLQTVNEIVASLSPRRPARAARAIAHAADALGGSDRDRRTEVFGAVLPEHAGPLTLAQTIAASLTDALLAHPEMVIVTDPRGTADRVGRVTDGVRQRAGDDRFIDTVGGPVGVVGLAAGVGLGGLLPVPQISSVADLHQAADLLRAEVGPLRFFSQGAFRNPMVIRVGGLTHPDTPGERVRDDHSVALLRDIPGLIVAVPSGAADAGPLLRACVATARVDGAVCVFVEPTGLYDTRDLHHDGDDLWLAPYPEPRQWSIEHAMVGRARVHGAGEHLTIITFGSGVRLSLRVAARLADQGVGTRVVDLRWLAPLPAADIVREASATGRVLVVDETRRGCGVAEGVLAVLIDAGYVGAARRVAASDSYPALGPAAATLFISETAIEQGARSLLGV